MLLFGRTDRAGVKTGKITVAFRNWETPRVSPGKTYRSHDLGLLFIERAEKIPIAAICERDAHAAGARSLKFLLNSYMRRHPECNPRTDECVRIQFRFLGDDEATSRRANDTHLTRDELDVIGTSLQGIDERAKGNGRALEILGLLARQEWTTGREVSDALRLNSDQIKRRMAFLKREGLAESSSQMGYRLTPRGMRFYTFNVTGK
jgi:biotin operon repressor